MRKAYLFDPDKGGFEPLDFDGHPFPMFDVDEFIVQRTSPSSRERNTFFLVAWNRRRMKSERTYNATTFINTMQMRVRFFQYDHATRGDRKPKPRFESTRTDESDVNLVIQ